MLLRSLTVLAATTVFLLTGCGKPSIAQQEAKERLELKEKKRQEAIKVYKDIVTEFPDTPRAKEAAAAAAALEAAGPVK